MQSVLQRGFPSGVSRIIAIIGLGLGAGMFYMIPSLELSMPKILTPPPSKVEVPSAVIVEEIRNSAKLLTTTVPGWAEVSNGYTSDSFFWNLFKEDHLRLMGYGEVFVGFDFKHVTEADIEQRDTEIVVHLGLAQIITTRLDNVKTYVLTKSQGFFKRVFGTPDIQLEGQARLEAERRITVATCERAMTEAVEKGMKEFQPFLQATVRARGDQRLVRVVAEKGSCPKA